MRLIVLFGNVKRISSVLFICTFFFTLSSPAAAFSQAKEIQTQESRAAASLEFGADSFERRFYQSKLSFHFPVKPLFFYIDMTTMQRVNSRLIGEVDFWLMTGFKVNLFSDIHYEGKINHFCRHGTSYGNSEGILDLNEVVGEFWLEKQDFRLGIGGGFYVGFYRMFEKLIVFNADFQRLFNSSISLSAEIKYAGLEEFIHDVEISCALNPGLDLFIRNSKTYEYRNRTYLGARFKSGGDAGNYFNHLQMKLAVFPHDEEYKMLFANFFSFEFFKKPESRVLFLVNAHIPVKARSPFFNIFDPEKIIYPLSVLYERKIQKDLFLFGYCTYNISMPFDVSLDADSFLGVGMGLRNLPEFNYLEKNLRYEVQLGYNFSHVYDGEISLGVNTVEKHIDTGSEIKFQINPDLRKVSGVIFVEFGKGVKIRPFIGYQGYKWMKLQAAGGWKFMCGVDFLKWF